MQARILAVGLAVLILAMGGAAGQAEDPVAQAQRALAYAEHGGVFDFGQLLKPGGKRELAQLAKQFERDGMRLWVVTFRPQVPADVAERLYANLSMTERDVLVVFNGKQVYGVADALKGRTDLFEAYVAQSRRGFNQYWAKGIGTYAGLIKGAIDAKRQRERTVRRLSAGSVLLLFLLLAAIVPVRRYQARLRDERAYAECLARARALFTEYGERAVADPSHGDDARLVDFSRRIDACEAQRDTRKRAPLDGLIGDLEAALAEAGPEEPGAEAKGPEV